MQSSASQNIPWTPRMLRLALAQFAMSAEPEVNLERALGFVRSAAAEKAQLVCLPELFRSPYFCQHEQAQRDYAEDLPGVVGAELCAEAKRLQIAIVGGSVFERAPDGKRYNTSLIIDQQGRLQGTYRKQHIPHDPAFYERNYFEEGNTGFKVFDLGFAKVAVLICYDQWFPEAARAVALMGAEIICYPTAIGTVTGKEQYEGDWQQAWETVQRGHAIANSVVVATINRVGSEGDSHFWGGSFVSDGFGNLLQKANNQETLLVAEVDLGHSAYARESWRFFPSRRPESYGRLVSPA